jgi:hypothetical protein
MSPEAAPKASVRLDWIGAIALALFCGLTALGVYKGRANDAPSDPRTLHPIVVKGKPIDSPVGPENASANPEPAAKSTGDGIVSEGEPGRAKPPGPVASDPPGTGGTAIPSGHDPNKHPGGAPAIVTNRPEDEVREYPDLTFEVLANFTYVPPPKRKAGDGPPKDQIPEEIDALSGKKVCVTGYMLPVEMEEDNVTVFLLMRTPMQCCFGVAPQLNEWVVVRMDKSAKPVGPEYKPVSAMGVLEVGEEVKDGWVTSLYRMTAVKVEVSK